SGSPGCPGFSVLLLHRHCTGVSITDAEKHTSLAAKNPRQVSSPLAAWGALGDGGLLRRGVRRCQPVFQRVAITYQPAAALKITSWATPACWGVLFCPRAASRLTP